jgi:hypothetical protein
MATALPLEQREKLKTRTPSEEMKSIPTTGVRVVFMKIRYALG